MEGNTCLAFIIIIVVAFVIFAIVSSNTAKEEIIKIKTNIQELVSKSSMLINEGFTTTKTIGDALGKYLIAIDTNSNKVAILSSKQSRPKILNFNEIIGCDVVQDNSTILSGGVGRSVMGGLIAGGAGAVVGATTRKSKDVVSDLHINIKTKRINDPLIKLNLIETQTERSSYIYKLSLEFAEKIQATMESIMSQN